MSQDVHLTRRDFLLSTVGGAAGLAASRVVSGAEGPQSAPAGKAPATPSGTRPNVLIIMTDQQRFDTIAALGNGHIHTPNLDRLVRRGLSFERAYSTCPVCVPARYTIRTGCEPPTTRSVSNAPARPLPGQPQAMEDRCGGPYLAKTMRALGYRTFGVGKFHAQPWDEDLGFDVHLHSEELYSTPDKRARDSYAAWIAANRPEYDFLEGLMGERTEMYYMPQMSPMPAEATVEWWAADRAIEQIQARDERPYFGFVSFVGPHPPFAPPVPFNRMYDPDRMPNPIRGEASCDHLDEGIPASNYAIWAEDINDSHARVLKARYYGEISYIDHCIGRILDAVEARGDAANTLIAFTADHGDHLGDHNAWQKMSFFEGSAHIPFLLSWPARLPADRRRKDLVCLTDLFAIATGAAGTTQVREGMDVLGAVAGTARPREVLLGYFGMPGARGFKVMVRDARYKYIYLAHGGREQLFDLQDDPDELVNLAGKDPQRLQAMRARAVAACKTPGAADALDGEALKAFEFQAAGRRRIHQFDASRGVKGFPEHPGDVLKGFNFGGD